MASDHTRLDNQPVGSDQEEGGRGRHRDSRRPRSPILWTVLLVVGSIMLVSAGLAMLWIVYAEVYGHEEQTKNNQSTLEQQWVEDDPVVVSTPGSTPTPKPTKKSASNAPAALAKLYIPNLDQTWYVVNGVDKDSLRYAPGHYPDSAMPGKAGNFAVAGHREPGMFWDLDKVTVGKTIIVETRTMRFTYTVRKNWSVKPTDTYVVNSVPPGFEQGDKLLTLTTCSKIDAKTRLIVQAELTGSTKLYA